MQQYSIPDFFFYNIHVIKTQGNMSSNIAKVVSFKYLRRVDSGGMSSN